MTKKVLDSEKPKGLFYQNIIDNIRGKTLNKMRLSNNR